MRSQTPLLILLPILTIAFWLRLTHGVHTELWGDEAFSLLLASYSWEELWARSILDVHPPLWSILLKILLLIASTSLIWVKCFMVLLGTIGVWLMYRLVIALNGHQHTALLSSAIFALHPFVILMSTDIRMYGVGICLLLLHLLIVIHLAKVRDATWYGIPLWVLAALSTLALLYTHYYLAPIAIGAIGALFPLIRVRHRWYITACILLGYAPWIPHLVTQVSQPGLLSWNTDPALTQAGLGLSAMLTGLTSMVHPLVLSLICVILLVAFYRIWHSYPLTRFVIAASACHVCVILGSALVVSWYAHPVTFIFWRYAIFLTILLIPLCALAVELLPKRFRMGAGILILIWFCLALSITLPPLQAPIPTSVRGALLHIESRVQESDRIVIPQSHILMLLSVLDPHERVIARDHRYTRDLLATEGNIALPPWSAQPWSRFEATPGRVWVITSRVDTGEYLTLPRHWTLMHTRTFREIRPEGKTLMVSLYDTTARSDDAL